MIVRHCTLPDDALLQRYRHGRTGDDGSTYTDCYRTRVAGRVLLADYVYAFYTTWLFRFERRILQYLVRKPSSDHAARELADGLIADFAAWYVEARTPTELLMCDFQGRTRSWFMVETEFEHGVAFTALRFGSAVVPKAGKDPVQSQGLVYRKLLPLHRLYSRLLLRATASRLSRSTYDVQY